MSHSNIAVQVPRITKEPSDLIIGNKNNTHNAMPPFLLCLPIENIVKLYPARIMWVYNIKNNNKSGSILNNNNNTEYMNFHDLKLGLIQLINTLPILAGEILEEDSESGSVKIAINNKGVLWTEAKANCNLNLIIPNAMERHNINNSDIIIDYNIINQVSLQTSINYAVSQPILSIQLTRFQCESVIIALVGQHFLFDANTAGQFMLYWSKLCNNQQITTKINWMDRSFLFDSKYQSVETNHNKHNSIKKDIHHDKTCSNNNNHNEIPNPPQYCQYKKLSRKPSLSGGPIAPNSLISQVLYFTGDELLAIKKAASKSSNDEFENKNNNNCNEWISTYDAIYAHMILSIWEAQINNPDNFIDKSTIISNISFCQWLNGRKLFNFNSSNNYFGSLAFWLYNSIDYQYLLDKNLSAIAKLIHITYSSQTLSSLKKFNQFLIPRNKELGYSENGLNGAVFGKNSSFHMSSWAKSGFYNCDFGFGLPDYCGPITNINPKEMWLLDAGPGVEDNNNGLEMVLALTEGDWKELMKIIHKYR